MNIANLKKILLTLILLVSTNTMLLAQSATGNDDQQAAAAAVATVGGGIMNGNVKNNSGRHEVVNEDLENREIKPASDNGVTGGDQEGSDGFGDNGDDNPVKSGDANGDGKVDIADVAAMVSYLNNRTPSSFNTKAADVDGNNVINLNDLEKLITSLLK